MEMLRTTTRNNNRTGLSTLRKHDPSRGLGTDVHDYHTLVHRNPTPTVLESLIPLSKLWSNVGGQNYEPTGENPGESYHNAKDAVKVIFYLVVSNRSILIVRIQNQICFKCSQFIGTKYTFSYLRRRPVE